MKEVADFPSTCAEIKTGNASAASGVYKLKLKLSPDYICYADNPNCAMSVYCDMDTEGGGWTTFQRRIHGNVSFQQIWDSYVTGFGSSDGDYWLGLYRLLGLTVDREVTLMVKLRQREHNCTLVAKYSNFRLHNDFDYRMTSTSFLGGNAGNSWENNIPFVVSGDCGWWNSCTGRSNLNGIWAPGCLNSATSSVPNANYWDGIYGGLKSYRGVASSEMMLRVSDYRVDPIFSLADPSKKDYCTAALPCS